MKEITLDIIRNTTGKAALKISLIDTHIIGFTVTGNKASACKKLIAAGYNAQQIGYGFIKVSDINFSEIR